VKVLVAEYLQNDFLAVRF